MAVLKVVPTPHNIFLVSSASCRHVRSTTQSCAFTVQILHRPTLNVDSLQVAGELLLPSHKDRCIQQSIQMCTKANRILLYQQSMNGHKLVNTHLCFLQHCPLTFEKI